MRRYLVIGVAAMVLVLLVLPTVLGRLAGQSVTGAAVLVSEGGSDSLSIHVFFPATGQVEALPLGEYLKGVVAAEMPPEFADEALKAQMVVARTYAVRRMRQFMGPDRGGCPLHPEADVCADHNTSQAYMSLEQAIEKFGRSNALAFWRRLGRIQLETEGLVLRHGNQLIDPLYHSVSGTMTEDAGEYFLHSQPYLKPVDDHWGQHSPRLVETVHLDLATVVQKLSTPGQAITVASIRGQRTPIQITALTGTGRVKTVRVGDAFLTGREFRERLGLRSSNFTVAVQGDAVTIQTTGYGHGVGMSQYGADGMARAGHTFAEILAYYYHQVDLGQLFDE